MDAITLTLIACFLAIVYFFLNRKRYNLPPGPKGYPFVGNTFEFKKEGRPLYKHFIELAKEHGDIFNFRLGIGRPENIIVLNNADLVTNAFVQSSDFDYRPSSWSFLFFTDGGRDIILGKPDDPVWRIQRKITTSGLRNFLSGSRLDSKIQASVEKGVAEFDKVNGKPIEIKPILNLMIYNVICDMLFNLQFDFNDKDFKNLYTNLAEVDEIFGNGLLEDAMPFVQYLPFKTSSTKRAMEIYAYIMAFFETQFREHVNKYDSENIGDLIDFLINAREKLREEDAELAEKFSDRHLIQTISDGFSAGVDTSTHSLNWLFYFMAKHPDIQDRVHKEIDGVIGNRQPTINDKSNLIYCEAAILETLRICPVGPITFRAASVDTKLDGYDIPKGSQVWANIYACHHDSRVWDDAEDFKPERFIDEADGKIVARPKSWLTFGAGKRACIGENPAKHQVFVFFVSLMQRFTFGFPDENYLKRRPTELDDNGIVCMAKPYEVIVSTRS
ncbi:cytochrome P450 2U1-like [Tubulanus polymorphus]|uniref:cytochrome P450 2U1-like n=1 Tax=Tubulanus polymorphus TaxID=672921 RepID=UPI003DA2F20B